MVGQGFLKGVVLDLPPRLYIRNCLRIFNIGARGLNFLGFLDKRAGESSQRTDRSTDCRTQRAERRSDLRASRRPFSRSLCLAQSSVVTTGSIHCREAKIHCFARNIRADKLLYEFLGLFVDLKTEKTTTLARRFFVNLHLHFVDIGACTSYIFKPTTIRRL